MGYYTAYTLTAKGNLTQETAVKINNVLKSMDIIGYALSTVCYDLKEETAYWYTADLATWYDHDEDMLEISAIFPEVTFFLEGDGEEWDDLWHAYYHHNAMEFCPADIVYRQPENIQWPPDPTQQIDETFLNLT